MNVFLLSFQDMKALDGGTRQTLTAFLDNRPEILNWHSPYERLALIISRDTAPALRQLLHGQFPDWFFILTPLDSATCTGWMHQATWEFIKKPTTSGQWEKFRQENGLQTKRVAERAG